MNTATDTLRSLAARPFTPRNRLAHASQHHSRSIISLSRRATRTIKWLARAGMFGLAMLCSVPLALAEPIDNWHSNPVGADSLGFTNDLLFANGKLWSVGLGGKVQHSSDGKVWTTVQTPTDKTLTSIIHGNGTFVATGYGLTLLSSPDGTTWTIRAQDANSPGSTFSQVIFANGKFLAFVGVSGQVRISTNGIDWTPSKVTGIKFYPDAVAWGDDLYAMVGSLDGNYTVQTSPDGITWTRRLTSFTKDLETIAYFNGLFIAGGTDTTPVICTSPDGITWTKVNGLTFPAADTEFWGIKVLNGRVFAFGDYGLLMSSSNGTDWTKHPTGTTESIRALEYDGNALVLAYSTDDANISSGSDPWASVGGGNPGGPGETPSSRIDNISTRGWVGVDASQMITGFVVQGASPKKVLVRAVGPTLAGFGVQGALADPQLRIVNAAGAEVATNNDWITNANVADINTAAAAVFAFGLPADSKDAVVLTTLQPGNYTIQISGVGSTTGIALAEVYDVDAPGTCRLVNISSRGFVGTGDSVSIPGFIVSGSSVKKLLIRGVGPTLGAFGVPGVITDPKIEIYNASQVKVAENDNWTTFADQAALTAASAQVFAFALNANSLDAATLVTLQPGAYTVVVSGNNNGTGVGLVEVYEVP